MAVELKKLKFPLFKMALESPKRFRSFLHGGLQAASSNWQSEERLMIPVLSYEAMRSIATQISTPISAAFPMVSLFGSTLAPKDSTVAIPLTEPDLNSIDPVFLNVNSPWSMFICGSQGSGKSHALACILESCLLSDPNLGQLPQPLAAMVFNYDKSQGNSVAEAASLCSHLKVRVLVSPSNFKRMEELYGDLSGAKENLVVQRFYLLSRHLNTERMMKLMAVGQQGENMPLYMQVSTASLESI
jgi:hypothetical protein